MEVETKNVGIAMDTLCVICQATSVQPYIDIYATQTSSSRCLLSEFISKTTRIMFDRDKLWSKTLCKQCYDLILELDQAEVQYLKLKNDFINVLSKNQLISKLAKIGNNVQTANTEAPAKVDKIEFFDFDIKSEAIEDDYERDASPLVSEDSDDEPLLGRKARKKKNALVDYIPDSMKIETVKCEFETPQDTSAKTEIFSCRSCKVEFDTKSNAALHAFSVHRVDIAKDPGIIKVKSVSGKKKRGRKKGKRKSLADFDGSDLDDPNKDVDWSADKIKPKQNNRNTRNSKRYIGRVLNEPIMILQEGEAPPQTSSTVKKTSNKELQKKLASSNITIKKIYPTNVPSLTNPIPIIPLDGEPIPGNIVIKSEVKDDANVIAGELKFMPYVPKIKTEKRQYIKKQKPLLTCTQCPATFTSQNRLDLHMTKHTGTLAPYICEICGAAYKHKKACDIHVEMHKGISPWKCSLCDKIFPSKGALCRHEAIHTGTPNYQCDLCGKSFIHTSSFKMHKLSHSGLKPHSCNKCGLALMTRSHLKRHQRVHSGEKRHECNTCGKKFSERYNLYAHQKSHDPSGSHVPRQLKTHDCTVCEASFNRRYVLEKHMETAHQRVMDPGPKKTRNTMTKLLKQQALQQQQLTQSASQSNTSDSHDAEVKFVTKTPPAHNTDSSSTTFIGESSFQHASGASQSSSVPIGLVVVTKEELPEAPVTGETSANNNTSSTSSATSAATSSVVSTTSAVGIVPTTAPAAAVVWQGLYQLANDYPLRMHGVDYLGRGGH